MGDLSVTNLYRKVVSPSLKYETESLKKETHTRHVKYHRKSPVFPSRFDRSPTRSACSAPGRVESQQLVIQSVTYGCHDNNIQPDGYYNFHPTTRFKTTLLPAMPLTKKYIHTAPGNTRIIPLSVMRHSSLSLPEKLSSDRPVLSTQRQRRTAEEIAKSHCRRLKRKSEIIAHRIDKQYYMSGIKIPVKSRWEVDTNDLLRLKILAHNKQLGSYKNLKDFQNVLEDSRESPGGQLSTPTPDKGTRYDESRGLSPDGRKAEGKWAEENESETSSIDEFDIISMRGRRIKLPLGSQQNDENSDGIKGEKLTNVPWEGSLGNNQENDNNESEEFSKSLPDENSMKKHFKEFSENEKRIEKVKSEGEETVTCSDNVNQNLHSIITTTKDQTTKPSSEKPRKKVKSIRFKDETSVKKSNKDDNTKEKNVKSSETTQDENHVNPYLDDWLGIKKKEVDGRYKPGKPPPNRIFITAEISKSKLKAQVAKFSEMFLTETIALQDDQAHLENDTVPESNFGIVNSKQKEVFKSMFDEVDKDKNGSVTLEELKLKMMPSVTSGDIKHFVQVFDLNNDKTVDSREFTAICCLNDRLAGIRTETADGSIALELEKLAQHIVIFKEMYKTMDEDDDNRLDANEVLVMVSAAMETEMGADLDVARKVVDEAKDEFGYIDFIGFMSYIPFFAKLLKTIMTNPLSIADIEKARERVKNLTFKHKKTDKKEPKSWEAF